MHDDTTTYAASSDRTSGGAPVRKPLMTALLLASGTLCLSGIVATILPASAGSTDSALREPAPVAAVVRAPGERTQVAEPHLAADSAEADADPVLPRAIERLAVTAAEAVAAIEQRIDQHAVAAPAGPAVTYASPAPAGSALAAVPPAATSTRIVYLVDASGSLLDSLPQVIEWLGDSLDNLAKGQEFTVLFFREGQVFEAPPRGLKPASFGVKASVWTWVQPEKGNVLPQGRSDLLSAVEAAMGYHPDELYIVSDDSFNRSASSRGDEGAILSRIGARLGRTPPTVHTVQFFYRDEAGALEAIADRFGGTYRFIEPADLSTSAATDPLLELSIVN